MLVGHLNFKPELKIFIPNNRHEFLTNKPQYYLTEVINNYLLPEQICIFLIGHLHPNQLANRFPKYLFL